MRGRESNALKFVSEFGYHPFQGFIAELRRLLVPIADLNGECPDGDIEADMVFTGFAPDAGGIDLG